VRFSKVIAGMAGTGEDDNKIKEDNIGTDSKVKEVKVKKEY